VGARVRYPASSIKRNQNIFKQFDSQGLPKSYQAAKGFYQNSKQVPLFNGPKAEKTSQTSCFQLQIKKGILQPMLRFGIKRNFSIVKSLT
jgi:hypothetical protein